MTWGIIDAIACLFVLVVVYASGFLHGRRNEQERLRKPPNSISLSHRTTHTETEDRYYE